MRQCQRVKRLRLAGIAVCVCLLLVPEWGLGQRPAREEDHRCQNCHGQEHIATISRQERETMVVVPESGLAERENPAGLYIDLNKISRSVHGQTTCNDCHQGAETLPHPARLPQPQCRSCHEEEEEDVSRSRHAEVRQRSEPPAPYCWDCHGSHEMPPEAEVNPLEKIRICASCHLTHSDRLEGVDNGEALVQFYLESVHARNIGEPGAPEVGATCEDCHGHHAVLPVNDPRSRVNRRNISETCGSCHPEILQEFESTVHADVAHRNDPSLEPALCNNCHTTHAITHAGTPEFMKDLMGECGSCHQDLYRTYQDTYHGQVQQLGGTRAARCSDCHGTHNIRRPDDPASTLSALNRSETCGRCHDQIDSLSASGRRNFVAYRPHADLRDRGRNPELFFIWYFALVLSIALLILWGLHWIGWLNRTLRERPALPRNGTARAVVRFKPFQRWIHLAAMCCVFGLILTGLPLKFSRQPAIAALTRHVAGVETLIFLHRLFAVFLGIVILCLVFYAMAAQRKRNRPLLKGICGPDSLWPAVSDVSQFAAMLRWFAKKGKRPGLDRWSYREKFDCWAAVIVLVVLAVSGTMLWFPVFFAKFLSGYWFNAAMVVHGYAGLLAMGLILLIHLLNTGLGWDGFHLNAVMFTGQISENELRVGRSSQYARLTETGALDGLRQAAASGLKLKAAKCAAAASQLLGIGLIILIVVAIMI